MNTADIRRAIKTLAQPMIPAFTWLLGEVAAIARTTDALTILAGIVVVLFLAGWLLATIKIALWLLLGTAFLIGVLAAMFGFAVPSFGTNAEDEKVNRVIARICAETFLIVALVLGCLSRSPDPTALPSNVAIGGTLDAKDADDNAAETTPEPTPHAVAQPLSDNNASIPPPASSVARAGALGVHAPKATSGPIPADVSYSIIETNGQHRFVRINKRVSEAALRSISSLLNAKDPKERTFYLLPGRETGTDNPDPLFGSSGKFVGHFWL